MKFTIAATIPTTQYGNIMPQIEVEARTFGAAYRRAMPRIEEIWARYCEPGRELRALPQSVSGNREVLTAFLGGKVYYDSAKHEYSNEAGEHYMSGSEFAHKFAKPFDAKKISEAMGMKYGVNPAAIRLMWQLKSEVSRSLGTAVHGALQLHGQYRELYEQLSKEGPLHDNPIVNTAVEAFFTKDRADQTALYEQVIVDHEAKRAGRVDRIVLIGPAVMSNTVCHIEDFKTDNDITKSLPIYSKQLNFYRKIIVAAGWTVAKMVVYHWNGSEWVAYPIEEENV
jgi:hypothetical protein